MLLYAVQSIPFKETMHMLAVVLVCCLNQTSCRNFKLYLTDLSELLSDRLQELFFVLIL